MTRQERRDPEAAISRRTLVHGLAAIAGATVAGAGGALAQGGPQAGPMAPPSTITNPPREFQPARRPDHLFLGP